MTTKVDIFGPNQSDDFRDFLGKVMSWMYQGHVSSITVTPQPGGWRIVRYTRIPQLERSTS